MEAIQEKPKRSRTRRINTGHEGMTQIDETTARLNTHEALCAERYGVIDDKMQGIEKRLDRLEGEIKEIKDSTTKGFTEIKELIEKRNNSSHTTLISTAGTIIVALIGFLGYLIMHGK